MIGEETIDGFLEAVASSEPTPGGGSVGAVAAATGAALLAMVARLTQGRDGFEAVSEEMGALAERADRNREALLALADRDAEAFDAVMVAFRLPKASDEEKTARSAAIQAAFVGAAAVPREVASVAVTLLERASWAIGEGNPDAASDGMSAASLLYAGVVSALANVEINAASLKDAEAAEDLRTVARDLSATADRCFAEARAAFATRMRS